MENEILVQSPNFTTGRDGYQPEFIVIHIMDGTLEGTDAWFKNKESEVSAHIGVGKNGELHRYVQDADTAWHTGIKTTEGATFNGFHYDSNDNFIDPNLYTLGIEHEGTTKDEITDEQYDISSQKIAEWCTLYKIPADAEHIVTHKSIYPGHDCPNGAIDMDKLIGLVQNVLLSQIDNSGTDTNVAL